MIRVLLDNRQTLQPRRQCVLARPACQREARIRFCVAAVRPTPGASCRQDGVELHEEAPAGDEKVKIHRAMSPQIELGAAPIAPIQYEGNGLLQPLLLWTYTSPRVQSPVIVSPQFPASPKTPLLYRSRILSVNPRITLALCSRILADARVIKSHDNHPDALS